jgi:hypothetical protein
MGKKLCWGCILFLLFVVAGCQTEQNAYFVIFEKRPNILSQEVLDRGTPIGEIVSDETLADNTTRLGIRIEADQRGGMTDQVVFLVDGGRLVRAHLKKIGVQQEPGAVFFGFRSKKELLWFKARTLFSRSAAASAHRKARRLAARFP